MSSDYKDWIADLAEELAQERYNKDYYSLPDGIAAEVWQHAEAEYKDMESTKIDAAYEAAWEAQLVVESEKEQEMKDNADR